MYWDQLKKQIYDASKQAFCGLMNSHKSEDFYAFALYTDSSAMTVSPSANSVERFSEKVDSELEEEEKTDENLEYYKWSTSEWAYEAAYGDSFSEINDELRHASARSDLPSFKKDLLKAMTEALAQLVDEGFFKTTQSVVGANGAVVFVSITDEDDAELVENESAKAINSKSTYDDFLRRYGSVVDDI